MSKKKTYIGYDLGDGETITDLATLEQNQISQSVKIYFDAMKMPDNNTPGRAIPSVFGYCGDRIVFASTILEDPELVQDVQVNFKRRPSDLLVNVTESRKQAIITMLEKGWPNSTQCPELYSRGMQQFSEAVITFTNAIFADETYQQKIADAAFDSEEIVFCVGHPTKWNDLDVAVYKEILRKSVLGTKKYANKPSSLMMAAESRAAYLHIKNQGKANALPKGTAALLIDVGSSTVDITAVTEDSRNHVYNSGNNYLGARGIDFAIQEWYCSELKKDPDDWRRHQKLMEDNPAMGKSLTLACRVAKEKCYSTSNATAKISDDFGTRAKITAADINKLITSVPVARLLKQRAALPADVEKAMGNRSYLDIFREFMQSEKKNMDKLGLKIGRVILTGSASQMGFVRQIMEETFGTTQILADMDPSRSISMGLALVGPYGVQSEIFEEQVNNLVKNEVPKIISNNMEKLADLISPVIQNKIESIITTHFSMWKSGQIKTLNQMSDMIKKACEGNNLANSLSREPEYIKAVNNWLTDYVSHEIALKLKDICNRNHVTNFKVDDLNVMKVPTINIPGVHIEPLGGMMSVINAIVTVVSGVLAAVLTPALLVILGTLTADLVFMILAIVFELLAVNPAVGIPVLAIIAGVAVGRLIGGNLNALKGEIMVKMRSFDLPKWVRKSVSDKKIKEKIAAQNLSGSIREAMLNEKEKTQITEEVSKQLRLQVTKRAEEIKYLIQSS